MKTFVSLLQSVEVGGKPVPMDELKRVYEDLELVNVETYLESGNVIFDSPAAEDATLSTALEMQIQKAFGRPLAVFILEPGDLQRILDENPFPGEGKSDPAALHVTFLPYPVSRQQWSLLEGAGSGADEFRPGEAEVYLFCPAGYGQTRLSNAFFEEKLNLPVTTRDWNTVQALARLAAKRA